MDIKLDHLLIYDPNSSQTCGEVIIEQANDAYFVLILEIDSNSPQDRLLLDNLVGQILDIYKSYAFQYTEKLLERMLEDLNSTIPNIISGQKSSHKVHCLLAVSQGKILQLAVWGRMKAVILRNNALSSIISATTEPDRERVSVFTSIIEGEIKENDKVVLSTENLFNFLAKDKIKKIIDSLPPVSAVGHLQNILENVPKLRSFFSVILEVVSTKSNNPNVLVRPLVQKSSQDSIEHLMAKQSSTQNILKPALSFIVLDRLKKTWKFIYNGFKTFFNIINLIIKTIINTGQKIKPQLWFNRLKSLLGTFKKWYLNLNNRQKLVFWVLLTIFVLLGQNLIFHQQLILRQQKQAQIKNQVSGLYILASEVESKLMYDSTAAQNRLNEFREKITELKTSGADKKALLETEQLYANLYQKVWHITPANTFTALAKNNAYNQIALGNDNNLLLISPNNLGALILASKQLSEQRLLADKSAQKLINLDGLRTQLIINSDLSALTYSQKALQPIQQLAGETIRSFDSLANYQSRVYVLDKKQNKIVRLLITKSSLQSAQAWVQDSNLVNQVQSITINDGQLYLQTTDSIIKISKGRVAGQTKILLNYPLGQNNKIFSQNNFQNLYLFDFDNQRLIILNKKLETISQLEFPKTIKIIDFTIDEAKRKIYLLTDSEILSQDYKY